MKLYLCNATAPYSPATMKGSWNDTSSAVTKLLDPANADAGTNAASTISRSATLPNDVLHYRGVTGKLAAQTLTGTLQVGLVMNENNASSDNVIHIHAYVTQGDSDLVRGTLISDFVDTTELREGFFGLQYRVMEFSSAQSVSSVALSANDRIVVEIGVRFLATSTNTSGATLRYGGAGLRAATPNTDMDNVGAANVLSWIEFSQDLVGVSALRTSQTVAETILKPSASPQLQTSQTLAETLVSPSAPNLQVSQNVIEVLINPNIVPLTGFPHSQAAIAG